MKVKDPWVAGGIASIIGWLAKQSLEWILSSLQLIPAFGYHYVVGLILPSEGVLPLYARIITYVFASLGSSAFFGGLLTYVYIRTGRDYWFVKAIAYAAIVFIVHVSMIPKIWEPQLVKSFASPAPVLVEIVWILIWSTVAGYVQTHVFDVTRSRSA